MKPKQLEAIKDNDSGDDEKPLKYKEIFDELSSKRIGEIYNMSKKINFNNLTCYSPYSEWAFLELLIDGGRGKKSPLPKICHTYPTMMKLGALIPYLKKSKKYINQVTHRLSSADISIFFTGNQQILLYQ